MIDYSNIASAYDVYEQYVALKCYFNQKNFDYFKYRRTNTSTHSFNNRHDKTLFTIIAKQLNKDKIVPFLISNFVINPNFHVSAENAMSNYKNWIKRNQNLEITLKNDCKVISKCINTTWKDYIFSEDFLQLGLNQKISIETFVIFHIHTNVFKYFDKKCSNFLWNTVSLAYYKYARFYENIVSKSKLQEIIKNN